MPSRLEERRNLAGAIEGSWRSPLHVTPGTSLHRSLAAARRVLDETWPVEDEYADVILCAETLEHVLRPAGLLAEAHTCLRPADACSSPRVRSPMALHPERLLAVHSIQLRATLNGEGGGDCLGRTVTALSD